jgi:short-subunit dehydrogenase/acyl dehydratase/acyl carrier protein
MSQTVSTPVQSIDSFAVGDYVTFDRTYTSQDFSAFSRLSGDTNPLHHDADFAARSRFGRPIVPLHVTLSPLSMIAGTVFPGEPSLYLGHEVRAISPVLYDERIRYSARIEAINASHRVLRLRVLGLRRAEVVLDATMRVQAQVAHWTSPPALPVRKGLQPATALITGATGEIGSAVARVLAREGWSLLLHDRGNDERRQRLQESLLRLNCEPEFIAADIACAEGQAELAAAIAERDDIALIVHVASPPVMARVEDLVAVNFSALKQIVDASLPQMLARPKAAVVLIGSIATEYTPPGWEGYSGAKAMAANLIDAVERSYATYGVRGFTVMPGIVATRFSEAFQGNATALLPQEVAEAIVPLLANDSLVGNAVILEPGSVRRGRLGFHAPAAAVPAARGEVQADTTSAVAVQSVQPLPASGSTIADIVRSVLRLPSSVDLSGAALGITPGWDSLKHIELLLEIEAATGVRFGSDELSAAYSFSALDALCVKKLAERAR